MTIVAHVREIALHIGNAHKGDAMVGIDVHPHLMIGWLAALIVESVMERDAEILRLLTKYEELESLVLNGGTPVG